ncbi:DUF4386 domain-containing protein [Polyangium jinanense]|uniref:DUF4386 domain-containing protein n=1 Tax=Polyangium jinanense TaxID=2829994 RepID=A0A9X4AT45_9BACT|nr:DUF4386 domain-containing protein [Polyangium jinanense]MDC3955807.1 DUF4386 domain-containing protein [Polyangium jinanense]MDC3983166.1 DUF4386 domain-containing protein [Polyangium jinanense]
MDTALQITDHASRIHTPAPSTYARITGLAYLLAIVPPVLNLVLIQPHLVQAGDVAGTAARIASHPTLFRLGLALDLVMFAAVLLLSAAHYAVLAPVDRNLSLVALVFRASEGVLGCVTVLAGAFVAVLAEGRTALDATQAAAQIDLLLRVRAVGMDYLLVLMCLGAIPFCWLFYTSRYVPQRLSGFGIVCYTLILLGSLTNILMPQYASYTVLAFAPGTLFELTIGVWLLLRGVSVPSRASS